MRRADAIYLDEIRKAVRTQVKYGADLIKFTATAGATFTWKGIAGNDQGVRMFRRWDADRRRWLIEMLHDDVYKIISANTGAFLSGIVE